VAVIVAHPDDEILWCGGLLLLKPDWSVFVACLCRGGDADRAPRFHRALESLGAQGAMGTLDDGPGQQPLPPEAVRAHILALLPHRDYGRILTHAAGGEYTRHRRHEETWGAVWTLWNEGVLRAPSLWTFAYEDGGGAYLPRAEAEAPIRLELPQAIWEAKRRLLKEVYNFPEEGWEVRATPRVEAFQPFGAPDPASGPTGKDA